MKNTNSLNVNHLAHISPSCLPSAEPLSLMDLCRRSVRVALGRDRLSEIHRLPLPASLKNYLLYQWRLSTVTRLAHPRLSVFFSCFSGILRGLNLSDNIAQASRTDSACKVTFCLSGQIPVRFLILFLWLFSIVISNFIKSGITEHYAHAGPEDAPTVTVLAGLCGKYLCSDLQAQWISITEPFKFEYYWLE